MESAAVAQVALAQDLPFGMLRCISDALLTPMPSFLQHVISPCGKLLYVKLARSIAADPRSVIALFTVGREAAKARRGLRYFAHRLNAV